MTPRRINEGLTTILTTAAELGPEPLPLGPIYAALSMQDYTMADYGMLMALLQKGGRAPLATTVSALPTIPGRTRE